MMENNKQLKDLENQSKNNNTTSPKTSYTNASSRANVLKLVYELCIKLTIAVIFFCLFIIVSVITFPLKLVCLLVTRLLQFIRHGDGYVKATQIKLLIRGLLYMDMGIYLSISVSLWSDKGLKTFGIRLLDFKHFSSYHSIMNWMKTIAMISGFCALCVILQFIPYALPRIPLEHIESGLIVPEAICEIVDCIILLHVEYEVLRRIPEFQQHKLFGLLQTWKWIEVSIYLLLAHNAITVSTHMVAWLTRRIVSKHLHPGKDEKSKWHLFVQKILHRNYLVYAAVGIRRSITFVWSSLLILLILIFYIRPWFKETAHQQRVLEFGIWSCLSLFVCSSLWLIKSCVLLSWEADATYTRLRDKILEAGEQLYFLGIVGRRQFDILNILYTARKKEDDDCQVDDQVKEDMITQSNEIHSEKCKKKGASTLHLRVINMFKNVIEVLIKAFNLSQEEDKEKNGDKVGEGVAVTKLFKQSCGLIVAYFLFIGLTPLMQSNGCSKSDEEEEEEEDEGQKNRGKDSTEVKKLSSKKRNIVKEELLFQKDGTETVYNVQQIAQYILATKQNFSKESYVSDILNKFNKDGDNRRKLQKIIIGRKSFENIVAQNPNCSSDDSQLKPKIKEELKFIDDWDSFQKLLKIEHSEDISYLKIQTWLEKAHINCTFLANTLSGAKEAADCLNHIFSGIIIGATIIMWLLLTGLATTQVFVLIATPLLAATFIFGDTCKSLFQGIVFVYVVHPFNVGDLCVIDSKLRVVKSVGVWRSTFTKVDSVGTREEMIFPNSELATKIVINHKTDFRWDDWDENLQFSVHLDGPNEDKVNKLKRDLEIHINRKEEDYKLVPSSDRVAVSAIDDNVKICLTKDNVKIVVRLRYNIENINVASDIQDWTYAKCLRRKKKIRALIDLDMLSFKRKIEGSQGGGTIPGGANLSRCPSAPSLNPTTIES